MSSSQLNSMPPELLGKIFGYLPVPDIFGLKLVGLTAEIYPCTPANEIPHGGQLYFP